MSEPVRQPCEFVGRKIFYLSQVANDSTVKASLANLRRGVGKHPGSVPNLWDLTLDGLPEEFLSKTGAPTDGEWAVHIALSLFALHQQGKDIKAKCMHKQGEPFGRAVRKLAVDEEDLPRVVRRFNVVVTSDGMMETSHHLRGLIQLLKASDIPLDYTDLAQDLFWFAKNRDNVRLKWGQDFYRYTAGADKPSAAQKEEVE